MSTLQLSNLTLAYKLPQRLTAMMASVSSVVCGGDR